MKSKFKARSNFISYSIAILSLYYLSIYLILAVLLLSALIHYFLWIHQSGPTFQETAIVYTPTAIQGTVIEVHYFYWHKPLYGVKLDDGTTFFTTNAVKL